MHLNILILKLFSSNTSILNVTELLLIISVCKHSYQNSDFSFILRDTEQKKTSISLMTHDLITLIAILFNSCHMKEHIQT